MVRSLHDEAKQTRHYPGFGGGAGGLLAAATSGAIAQSNDDAYLRLCAPCHGPELRGGETGPALMGSEFQQRWSQKPTGELETFTRTRMPPTNPNSLSNRDLAVVINRIRRANGWPVSASSAAAAAEGAGDGKRHFTEWLSNRGDLASTSYSPLDQINRDNVRSLRVAWRWKSDNFGPTPEFYYRATPLMADGVLYTTAGMRRTVVAIDAVSGETLWMYRLDEGARGTGAPRRSSGRGVSFWRSPNASEPNRIYSISPGFQLIALDARTGQPIASFGDRGLVDLKVGLPRVNDLVKSSVGSSSPPVIVGNSIVVGVAFSAGGAPPAKEAIPGFVRAYDLHTGALEVDLPHHSASRRVRQRHVERSKLGNTPATLVSGRRSRQTRSAATFICLSKRPLAISMAAIDTATICSPTVSSSPGCRDGKTRLALPDTSSRHLGLRPARAAGAARCDCWREEDSCGRAGDEDRQHLRASTATPANRCGPSRSGVFRRPMCRAK